MIDRGKRHEVEVGCGAALERSAQDCEVRCAVAAFAVDQDKRMVGAQAAKLRGKREVSGVAAKGLRVERRNILGKRLDHVRLTDIAQNIRADHLDRRRAVCSGQARDARAGNDDCVLAGWLFVSRRALRPGAAGIHHCKADQHSADHPRVSQCRFHPSPRVCLKVTQPFRPSFFVELITPLRATRWKPNPLERVQKLDAVRLKGADVSARQRT